MITCPVCGFRNLDANVRCLKCRALLRADEAEYGEAVRAAGAGAESAAEVAVRGTAERFWRWLPLRRFWRVPEHVRYRFPFTAGLLSLVAGLGQIYNRQPAKAALLGGAWWAFAAACIATIHESYSNILLLALLFAWFGVWNDAVGSSIRINGERWSIRNGFALFFAIMCFTGILITLNQFFLQSFFTLVHVYDTASEPQIKKHDLLLVNHTAFWFGGEPKVGDVIYFDPDRFKVERGHDMTSINIKDYFQRVVGVAGDKISKKGGRWYRNGKEIAATQEPFGGTVIPDNQEWTVPAGRVFAPITGIPTDLLGSIVAQAAGATLNPHAVESGYIWIDWDNASMPDADLIKGRASAVLNPPAERKWLGPGEI